MFTTLVHPIQPILETIHYFYNSGARDLTDPGNDSLFLQTLRHLN
jgi:hypothetical protein